MKNVIRFITYSIVCVATILLFIITSLSIFVAYILADMHTYVAQDYVGGVYNPTMNLIMCDREASCIHEVGHWLDKELGYISHTQEFKQAVDDYLLVCKVEHLICNGLLTFPGINGNPYTENGWGGYSEVYAQLYQYKNYDHLLFPSTLGEFFVIE